jgi:hypothetical protein
VAGWRNLQCFAPPTAAARRAFCCLLSVSVSLLMTSCQASAVPKPTDRLSSLKQARFYFATIGSPCPFPIKDGPSDGEELVSTLSCRAYIVATRVRRAIPLLPLPSFWPGRLGDSLLLTLAPASNTLH